MTQARKRLVSLSDTPYYHCVSRCVRRAFLCGQDAVTGYSFEHRRQWIVDRLLLLADAFAIDLCAYAIMSNHYHVVVRIDTDQVSAWSDREVAERWGRLFSGPSWLRPWLAGDSPFPMEQDQVSTLIKQWRRRLISLSWFMRCLNEPIARMANAEDGCTGRFWEGRFKSQALLDESALLSCMAYVDLNPVRAAIAKTPEQSDYTSIQQRIYNPDGSGLRAFSDNVDDSEGIPGTLRDYLQLVDWAGRAVRSDKKGHIPSDTPPILVRLGIAAEGLADFLTTKQDFPRVIGPLGRVRQCAEAIGQRFFKATSLSRGLYTKPA